MSSVRNTTALLINGSPVVSFCYYDDEHGETSWRDEAGYPEGFGCFLDGAPFKQVPAANRDEWL